MPLLVFLPWSYCISDELLLLLLCALMVSYDEQAATRAEGSFAAASGDELAEGRQQAAEDVMYSKAAERYCGTSPEVLHRSFTPSTPLRPLASCPRSL